MQYQHILVRRLDFSSLVLAFTIMEAAIREEVHGDVCAVNSEVTSQLS